MSAPSGGPTRSNIKGPGPVQRVRNLLLILLGGLALAMTPPASAQDGLDPENTLVIELETGTVTVQLLPDVAPLHVARVKELAREGFYDGVVFHRVIPGFMAQTGDPTGTGTGGSSKPDLKAEFSKVPFERGTIGAARTQNPNSANSQFFICFDDARFLDKQYTVWGQVVEGMEAVDALPKGEPPRNPGKIVSAKAE